MTTPASELRLYFLLQSVAHQLKLTADNRLRDAAGISTAQAAVLTIVRAEGAVSQRLIAHTLNQNESAVTTMVSRLLDLGLLSRTRHREDRRAWQLKLTRAGHSALRDAQPAFDEVNASIEATLAEHELRNLAGALQKLVDALSRSSVSQ